MRTHTLFAATAIAVVSIAGATAADDLDAYRKAIEEKGLTPVIPVNAGFQAGFVYKLVKNADDKVFPQRICANAFITPPTTTSAGLPGGEATKKIGFNASLKFLPKLVGDKIKAALGFDTSRVRTVDLSFDKMVIQELAEKNTLAADGETVLQRVVNPACKANLLAEEQRNGKFTSRVFVVIRAISADALDYSMTLTDGGQVGAGKDAGKTEAKTDDKAKDKAGEKTTAKPAAEKPVAEQQTADKAAADKPADKPAADGADKKDDAKPVGQDAAKADAGSKPAANTGTLAVTVADVIDVSVGWTYAKTGAQSFKVKQEAGQPALVFAADVKRIKTVSDISTVDSEPKLSLVLVEPKKKDLEYLEDAGN